MSVIDIRTRLKSKSPGLLRVVASESDPAFNAYCAEMSRTSAEMRAIERDQDHHLYGGFIRWVRTQRDTWAKLHSAELRRPTAEDRQAFEAWLIAGRPTPSQPRPRA